MCVKNKFGLMLHGKAGRNYEGNQRKNCRYYCGRESSAIILGLGNEYFFALSAKGISVWKYHHL